jgi:glycosyltransferase involved in cell wall biosynthesis
MENNPFVSVCVQTYQHADFIAKCLDGILMQQTDFPVEIIVGEDESVDGTREICVHYAEKYPERIRLFLRSRGNVIYINGKPTGRYNFIENLKAAKGKYLAFCEGDDYWTDSFKLQKQVNFLENNPDYSLTFHDATVIDAHDKILIESCISKKVKVDQNPEDAFLRHIPTATVMFRNYLIKELPKEFYKVLNVDRLLFALLAQHGAIKYINDIKPSMRRIHPGGMWSSQAQVNKHIHRVQIMETLLIVLKPVYKKRINHYLSVRSYRVTAAYIEHAYSLKTIFQSYLKSIQINIKAKNKTKAFIKGHRKIASSVYKLIKKNEVLLPRR